MKCQHSVCFDKKIFINTISCSIAYLFSRLELGMSMILVPQLYHIPYSLITFFKKLTTFSLTKFQNIQIVSPFYVLILGNKGVKLFKGGYYLGKYSIHDSMASCMKNSLIDRPHCS